MTDFLYPFIEADERDAGPLLIDLAASARGKAEQSAQLVESTLAACRDELQAAAAAMAGRFAAGGRLFTFGNGGSSTDAESLAALFADPPSGRALPARSLTTDQAVLTALGNDVGFELVFSRQIIAHAHEHDMALAISTSGNSNNVIAAIAEAKKRRLLTLGLAGYDGGQMAASPHMDHCLVVRSDSVHRVQESQAVLGLTLWTLVHEHLQALRSMDAQRRNGVTS